MNPKIKKLVFSIQDVETSDKHTVAGVFCDIHLHSPDKQGKSVVSFTMALSQNKEFQRCIKSMVAEVLKQNAEVK